MATYVDLSDANSSGGGICVYESAPSQSQQYDFSSYSSYFSNLPTLLNIVIDEDVTVAANTALGSSALQITDEDPNSGKFSISYTENLQNATSSSLSIDTGQVTYSVRPYDFNGTTTFNVWLAYFPSPSVTLGASYVCILGYWY